MSPVIVAALPVTVPDAANVSLASVTAILPVWAKNPTIAALSLDSVTVNVPIWFI